MGSQLDKLVGEFNKKYKEDIVAKGIKRIEFKRIPFSSTRLNYMLYGGLPRGKLIEFSGEENGGKTTTALDACKNAQILFQQEWEEEMENCSDARKKYLESRGPQKVVYADCENTLDEDWARTIGVDVDEMIVIKPQTQAAEDIFQMLLDMMDTDEVGFVVIDSLGVMLSKQAYEKSMDEKTYGGISMPLTLFSKKAELICARTLCTCLGINQMREDMNNPYGGTTTTGGKAWKHNCALRMQFSKGAYFDEKGNDLPRRCDEAAGNKVTVSIIKNKICKPDRRTGFYTLNYTYGVDDISDIVEVAMKYDIIQQSGAWFTFVDPETGEIISDEEGKDLKIQGKQNVIALLRDNDILLDELKTTVNSMM